MTEETEVNEVTEVTKLTSHHHQDTTQYDALTDKIKRTKQRYDQMVAKTKAQIKGSRGSQ